MAYIVSLVDCTDSIQDTDGVTRRLGPWFRAAGDTRRPAMPVTIGWTNAPTALADIVIYFVSDFRHSVVRYLPHFTAPEHWAEAGGLTALSNPRGNYRSGDRHGSEVYVAKWSGTQGLAMAAFHEAMHNQLRVDVHMHVDPSNYGGGIAVQFPLEGTEPNAENIRRFAGVMDLRHDQLLDGYARSHRTRQRRRPAGPPAHS